MVEVATMTRYSHHHSSLARAFIDMVQIVTFVFLSLIVVCICTLIQLKELAINAIRLGYLYLVYGRSNNEGS